MGCDHSANTDALTPNQIPLNMQGFTTVFRSRLEKEGKFFDPIVPLFDEISP